MSGTEAGARHGAWNTLRRGLALSPRLRRGLPVTVALGLVGTLGKVLVPVAVQQGLDHGLRAAGGPDLHRVVQIVSVTAAMLVVTVICQYWMNVRLYIASESSLAHSHRIFAEFMPSNLLLQPVCRDRSLGRRASA